MWSEFRTMLLEFRTMLSEFRTMYSRNSGQCSRNSGLDYIASPEIGDLIKMTDALFAFHGVFTREAIN